MKLSKYSYPRRPMFLLLPLHMLVEEDKGANRHRNSKDNNQ